MNADPRPRSPAEAFDSSRIGHFDTPILLIVFNRPDTTKQVMASIRAVSPTQLYVAADGPRPYVRGDTERCKEARAVATSIDWDCSVSTFFRDEHRGLAKAMSSALDWFFGQVDDGIILEDDCVPSRSFFLFCSDLLDFYRSEPRVMHISGDNFQLGRKRGNASYYFSRYPFVWGWASWRRAWEKFDFDVDIPNAQRNSWAAKWVVALERNDGAAVVPNVNLVQNVGFGDEATHTTRRARFAFLPAGDIVFPLVHPSEVTIDRAADVFTYYANFRDIRVLGLMPLYQLLDGIRLRFKSLKRALFAALRSKVRDRR